jgi:hypothetical protein
VVATTITPTPAPSPVPTDESESGEEFVPPGGLPTTGDDFVPPDALPVTGEESRQISNTLPNTGGGFIWPVAGVGLALLAILAYGLRGLYQIKE